MDRRGFLRQVVAGAGGLALAGVLSRARAAAPSTGPASAPATSGPAGKPPNIVIVLADDMGWRDTSYQGSPMIQTPALDEVATTGVRFNYFYAAQQMCSPGRFGILTGRTPFRTGLHALGAMDPREITLAEALRTAGYHTGHFGKWHLGGKETHPLRKGFDVSRYSPNYFDIGGKLAIDDTKQTVEVTGDSSVFTMGLALDWIRQVSKDGRPFFAYVCFGSPHGPHQGAPEFLEKYKKRVKNADFCAEVAGVDAAVGQLRAELRKLGLADNTILWFTSDNGGITPQSLDPSGKGKQSVGVRTVGCLEWPGRIKQPICTDVVCAHMDMYPTLLEIAGVRMPHQPILDGVSLVPLLDGRMTQRPRPVGFMQLSGAREEKTPLAKADLTTATQGVWIDGRYKLVRTPPGARGGKYGPGDRLYDIYADPAEKDDLSAKLPDQVQRMSAALAEWQRSVHDSLAGKDYVKP